MVLVVDEVVPEPNVVVVVSFTAGVSAGDVEGELLAPPLPAEGVVVVWLVVNLQNPNAQPLPSIQHIPDCEQQSASEPAVQDEGHNPSSVEVQEPGFWLQS